MNILLVDHKRKIRNRSLGKAIEANSEYNKYNIDSKDNVNGKSVMEDWGDTEIEGSERCLKTENGDKVDVVLLHVGDNQSYYLECLQEVYHGHIVVCFSGLAHFPVEVKQDCVDNPYHLYYPKVFTGWNGDEVAAIFGFIGKVEVYQQMLGNSNPQAKEFLNEAKEALQGIRKGLEEVLKDLTEKLRALLLKDAGPTQEELKNLADERDWKFKALAENV